MPYPAITGATWPTACLGAVVDIRLSSVDKKTKPNEHAVRLCNYTDVYRNTFIRGNMDFMPATATDREIEKCSLAPGDVVITKDSEQHDDIGVPALVRESAPDIVCGYHLAILRPSPECLDGAYLFYALSTGTVQQQFHSYANGVTRFGLRKSDIARVEIPLPPLDEQRAIGDILQMLDDKIELNRRRNETLEAMAQAIFRDWFVDFGPVRAKMDGRAPYLPPEIWKNFPDRLVKSESETIPAGWNMEPLGTIVDFAYGKTLKAADRKGGSIPVYGSNGRVGWHDTRLVAGPGIVVGRKGNPGVVTWVSSDFFPIDTTFYVIPRKSHLNLYFLFFALSAQRLRSISADSAVPGLNRRIAYMSPQVLPDKTLIGQFGELVEVLFQSNRTHTEESRLLSDLRDVLRPALVSGNEPAIDAKASLAGVQ